MIQFYNFLTTLLYPFLIIFLYYRKIIKKEDPKRFKEKIMVSHFNVKRRDNCKLIWFHAASVGEYKSILPIIKELNAINKKLEFLITTVTLSSGNLATKELKKFENIEHRFLPFDVPFLIDKFLNLWKPNKIFLVDSEIWPNLILKAKKNKIPIALINARITSKSFRKWSYFPNTAKRIFKNFDLCLCSNPETKGFLESFNVKNVYYEGNLKLIVKIDKNEISDINENFLSKKLFWFSASTHEGEENFCFKIHIELRKKFKDLKTIIAPRHIERVNEIKDLSKKFSLNTQILNKNEKILDEKEVILINNFGSLNAYFKYAKYVFMGKSMIKKLENVGGQNPMEAAKLGCKIYHGPYVYNFKDIYEFLEKNNISKKIENYQELCINLSRDLESTNDKTNDVSLIDKIAQETQVNTMRHIDNFLSNENI